MELDVRCEADTAVFTLSGELDLATSDELHRAVRDALHAGSRSLVLDLSDIRFIDSSGISALLETRTAARDASATLQLGPLSARVSEVLRFTGVEHLFDPIDT
ncbi:MAG: STAS domain-containing protein [Jatrophihabitans sp.]|uniref:STAS domain-containing protein n=1 Tax=Jatrophihabitans sp. TaxID=1932789 RepID=UPI00390DBC7F